LAVDLTLNQRLYANVYQRR